MFSCEFCEISKNTFFYRTPPVAASAFWPYWTATPIIKEEDHLFYLLWKRKYFVFPHLREKLLVPKQSLIIHGSYLTKEDKVFKSLWAKKREPLVNWEDHLGITRRVAVPIFNFGIPATNILSIYVNLIVNWNILISVCLVAAKSSKVNVRNTKHFKFLINIMWSTASKVVDLKLLGYCHFFQMI